MATKWNVKDENGHTEHAGKETYNEDGTLKRYDNYSHFNGEKHVHQWIEQQPDGSYKYGWHDNSSHYKYK